MKTNHDWREASMSCFRMKRQSVVRRRFVCSWLVALLGVVCCAWPAMGAYETDIARWLLQDSRDAPATGSILFAGSSSIRRWEMLAKDFADYKIIQRGFGGSKFDDLIGFRSYIVLPYQPQGIVVWEGTNDIAGGDDGQEVYLDYVEFVTEVHAVQPDVEIFYLGITPTPSRWGNRVEEGIANSLISAYTAGDPKLHYIDLPAAFWALNPPYDPAFTSLFVDSLHLTEEGYELWTSVIRPAVEAVIAPNKVYTANVNTPGPGGRIFFDFGPSNTDDGDQTVNPDVNGNYWNNWHRAEGGVAINAGEHIGNLIDTNGTNTGVDLTVTGGFSSNGKLNGGLMSPQASLLGDMAIASATEDYFYASGDGVVGGGSDDMAGGFMVDGLDPEQAYDLRFFGSRSSTETRVTEYRVSGGNDVIVALTTSGNNIGHDGVYDGNDDTFAVAECVIPDEFGQIFVDMKLVQGSYCYINMMEIAVRWPGDWDGDGQVALADGTAFVECLSGPEVEPLEEKCLTVFDFDGDGDVDLLDFMEFQQIFVGP